MRDKFEARRLRAEVLDAAKARGMDPAQLEAEASGTPGGSAPASGATAHLSSGEGCELDRRLPMRSGSRMQQIAPLAADGGANVVTATEVEKASEVEMEKVGAHESTLPAVELTRKGSAFALPPPIPLADLTPSPNAGEVPPAEPLPAELPLEPPPPPSDVPQGLPGWGKKPLPLKFRDKALEIARARLEEKPVPSPPRPPSPDLPKDAPPPLPSALEQRLGLRSRPPRVDLSNLPDERKHTD